MRTKTDCLGCYWTVKFLDSYANLNTSKHWKTYLDRFFDHIQNTMGATPNEVDFLNFTTLGCSDLFSITLPIGEDWIADFLRCQHKQGVTPRTYYETLMALRLFFNYLIGRTGLKVNPVDNIEPPKLPESSSGPKNLSLEEAWDFLDAAGQLGLTIFTLIEFLIATGARPGETVNARSGSLDFKYDRCFVCGKTKTRRHLLTPGITETLHDYLKSPYYKKMRELARDDYLFFSKSGTGAPLTDRELDQIVKRVASLAGIEKNITTNWLWHTFATLLADGGMDLPTLQQVMDHDREKNTRVYLKGRARPDVRNMINNSSLTKLAIDINNRIPK